MPFERSPVTVGAYTLVPHKRWMLWSAVRDDGEEIPLRLRGQFTDPEDFRQAAETIHGDDYSWERFQAERKAFLARKEEAARKGVVE